MRPETKLLPKTASKESLDTYYVGMRIGIVAAFRALTPQEESINILQDLINALDHEYDQLASYFGIRNIRTQVENGE